MVKCSVCPHTIFLKSFLIRVASIYLFARIDRTLRRSGVTHVKFNLISSDF